MLTEWRGCTTGEARAELHGGGGRSGPNRARIGGPHARTPGVVHLRVHASHVHGSISIASVQLSRVDRLRLRWMNILGLQLVSSDHWQFSLCKFHSTIARKQSVRFFYVFRWKMWAPTLEKSLTAYTIGPLVFWSFLLSSRCIRGIYQIFIEHHALTHLRRQPSYQWCSWIIMLDWICTGGRPGQVWPMSRRRMMTNDLY